MNQKKKFHVLIRNGDGEWVARCGSPLAGRSLLRLENVPLDRRCQHPGCRRYWPEGYVPESLELALAA